MADHVCEATEGSARPAWPVAIGVLSIVVAGQELYAAILAWARFYVTRASEGYLPGDRLDPVLSIPLALLAILLLAAGVLLLRRSQRGLIHAGYAIIKLAWVFLLIFLAEGEARQYRLGLAPILLAVLEAIPSVAYPVFLLIWFYRPSIRQQMSNWRPCRPPLRQESP